MCVDSYGMRSKKWDHLQTCRVVGLQVFQLPFTYFTTNLLNNSHPIDCDLFKVINVIQMPGLESFNLTEFGMIMNVPILSCVSTNVRCSTILYYVVLDCTVYVLRVTNALSQTAAMCTASTRTHTVYTKSRRLI